MENKEENLKEFIQNKMEAIQTVHHVDLKKQKKYSNELLEAAKKINDFYGIAFAYAFLAD